MAASTDLAPKVAIAPLPPGTEVRQLWRDAAAGFSLANLCYVRIWWEIISYNAESTFVMKSPPGRAEFVGVALNMLVAGVLLALLFRKLRRGRPRPWPGPFECLLLATLWLPANGLRAVFVSNIWFLSSAVQRIVRNLGSEVLYPTVACFLLVSALFLFAPGKMVRVVRTVCLILLPLLAVVSYKTAQKLWTWDVAPFLDKPLAWRLPLKPGAPRVVWVILDELDYSLAFANRPPGLALAELDRLRGESVSAGNAFSPSSRTLASVPALLTGKFVQSVRPVDQDEGLVQFAGERRTLLGSTPTVFYRARADGFNTAVAGWYLPYCRVFNDALTECFWLEMPKQYNARGTRLSQIMPNQTWGLLELWQHPLASQVRKQQYYQLLDRASAMAMV